MAPLLIAFVLLSLPLNAQDFGCFGETFPIQEENILDYLRRRLAHANADETELVTKKLTQVASEPKALNLPNASRYRCAFFDPTITAKIEIKDHAGNVIVPKGTQYNPLDHHSLNTPLLFFDGTQASHLKWAKAQKIGVWVLVKGKPLELEKTEERPVYFDQFGWMTSKLGVQSIPALVTQEGRRLKIQEFVVEVR